MLTRCGSGRPISRSSRTARHPSSAEAEHPRRATMPELLLLGGLAILAGVLLLGYLFVNADPARLARVLKWAGVGVGIVAVLALLVRSESTRLNSSHSQISYAVFCLKKKKT